MKRTLVIGDIHGGLKALKQVLERAEVTPKDQLIFLGDYVDGWSESSHIIQFLIELSKKKKVGVYEEDSCCRNGDEWFCRQCRYIL